MSECVCVRECVCVCLCVCVCERERERERECVCVCVCVHIQTYTRTYTQVNLASRLCAHARNGEICVSQGFVDGLRRQQQQQQGKNGLLLHAPVSVELQGRVSLKGVRELVDIYTLKFEEIGAPSSSAPTAAHGEARAAQDASISAPSHGAGEHARGRSSGPVSPWSTVTVEMASWWAESAKPISQTSKSRTTWSLGTKTTSSTLMLPLAASTNVLRAVALC